MKHESGDYTRSNDKRANVGARRKANQGGLTRDSCTSLLPHRGHFSAARCITVSKFRLKYASTIVLP
jgi:hypothetical protein